MLSSVVESPVRISSVVVAAPEGGAEGDAEGVPMKTTTPRTSPRSAGRSTIASRSRTARCGYGTRSLASGRASTKISSRFHRPAVASCPPPPPNLSSASGLSRGWVACGASINWIAGGGASGGGTTEVTLGATGRKAGFSKKNARSPKSASRLCAASLAARFVSLAPKFAIDLRAAAAAMPVCSLRGP